MISANIMSIYSFIMLSLPGSLWTENWLTITRNDHNYCCYFFCMFCLWSVHSFLCKEKRTDTGTFYFNNISNECHWGEHDAPVFHACFYAEVSRNICKLLEHPGILRCFLEEPVCNRFGLSLQNPYTSFNWRNIKYHSSSTIQEKHPETGIEYQ